jgi:hypothetical protein
MSKSRKEHSKFPKKSLIPPRILQQYEIIKMELSSMGVAYVFYESHQIDKQECFVTKVENKILIE